LSDYSKPHEHKVSGVYLSADRPAREVVGGREVGGSEDYKKKVTDSLKPVVDRIILETQRSIDYYKAQFREGVIQKVVLTGGVSLMPGLVEYFSTYFEAEVLIDNPFQNLRCNDAQVRDLILMAPRFSTSVGLALRRSGE